MELSCTLNLINQSNLRLTKNDANHFSFARSPIPLNESKLLKIDILSLSRVSFVNPPRNYLAEEPVTCFATKRYWYAFADQLLPTNMIWPIYCKRVITLTRVICGCRGDGQGAYNDAAAEEIEVGCCSFFGLSCLIWGPRSGLSSTRNPEYPLHAIIAI